MERVALCIPLEEWKGNMEKDQLMKVPLKSQNHFLDTCIFNSFAILSFIVLRKISVCVVIFMVCNDILVSTFL